MKTIWNEEQKKLTGKAFIPENQPPKPFNQIPFPCTFCYQGNAYRRFGLNQAFRLDSQEEIEFKGDELVYPQTNTKSIWQDAH